MRDLRAPHPDAALVLQRWNSWVRLYWPASDETHWVNLDEVPGFELLREEPLRRDDAGEAAPAEPREDAPPAQAQRPRRLP